MRTLCICLFISLVAVFVMPPEPAVTAEVKILDTTVARYVAVAKTWEPEIRKAATRLFFALCIISLVYTAGFGLIRGNFGLGDFFSEFIKFGLTMGFFYWLLQNGPRMASSIITSMALLGQRASTDYLVELTPSDIVTYGFDLLYRAVSEFGQSDYSTGICIIVSAMGISLVFGVIAAQMVVLLCSAWVMIYAGIFYLGFGGGRWTTSIAINYLKTIFALSMQIFTFCLLIGIGQKEIARLTTGMRTAKNITVPNYWSLGGLIDDPVKVVHSETLTLSDMCVVLVFAVILMILVNRLPGLVAGIITGSSITAMSFGGVGGAMSTASNMVSGAAGMAAGAGMMASQAAGAGMTLSSAYLQTVDNMQNGAGKFTDAAFSGGLAGAMSKGLTFAGDMMANMASGAKDAAKESLQKNTMGGAVAAQIDAARETATADRAAKEDEETKTGEAADGVAGKGTDSMDFDGGGAIGKSEDNSGEQSSAGGAGTPNGFDDTFSKELMNYDPKNVGLPDSK